MTSEPYGRKDGRGRRLAAVRGKSELRRVEVPGENQGGGREPVDSPDWRAGRPVREQQKPYRAWQREPAEKGNPPCSNLRSDRYQVARRGRKSRAAVTREGRPVARPREMTIVNRTRLTFRPARLSKQFMVPLAQSAERLSVEQEVTGSSPVRHPRKVA